MEEKYPELKGICKYCGGCNRLENTNFEGVWKCENFRKE